MAKASIIVMDIILRKVGARLGRAGHDANRKGAPGLITPGRGLVRKFGP